MLRGPLTFERGLEGVSVTAGDGAVAVEVELKRRCGVWGWISEVLESWNICCKRPR